ncbi:MAG TPA: prephenate dehydrogenase/arogenate dehydrogenase family protein, partial [Burkholderiales bacterium]|nr:prephenate dehydrogenase/arogenate dehydrogenase family protein [Burkholderiales bacterium]
MSAQLPRGSIGKLVVIGVGLIGGSFSLALKKAGCVKHVVGVGRSRANLDAAVSLGVIDEAADDASQAVKDADFVLIATPVGQMPEVMAAIAPALGDQTIVTDGGSTKQDVIAYAERFLGRHFERFVPSHPIAGTEKSGATAAFAELYCERNVILAPQPGTRADAAQRVRAAWEACGARVIELEARHHDEIFAAVSHLPHVVAFALVSMLAKRPDAGTLLGFSGGGLRDTVRIAGSSPEMWRDICMANRDALILLLDDYVQELERARAAIESGDGNALEGMFERARNARRKW